MGEREYKAVAVALGGVVPYWDSLGRAGPTVSLAPPSGIQLHTRP